jgi:hypothetical protein
MQPPKKRGATLVAPKLKDCELSIPARPHVCNVIKSRWQGALSVGGLAGRTAASFSFSPTEEKFIRLALDPAARDGEIKTSAAKLIESLRRRGVRAEQIICSSELGKKTAIEKAAEVRLTFGRYRGQPIADIPADYLQWALQNVSALSHAQRSAIRLILATEGAA